MNVYYNGNGDIWRQGRSGAKLSALPVRRTFLWGKQEVFIPAVYVGKAGVVLDVCTKIPVRDMTLFLKKWDKDKRLSATTKEEFDQLDADNPAAREFMAGIRLNGAALTTRMFSSIRWYPEEIFSSDSVQNSGERLENNKTAEEMMSAYGCDRKCCWHFARLTFDWTDGPILAPTELSLSLQARPFPVTAGHFTTNLSCAFPARIQISHPVTGQEFTLTLHGLEQTRHDFTKMGQEGVVYPEYNQILSYSVSPEIGRDLFDILDCADADHPRVGKSCGPTAIFMSGKNPAPSGRSSCSALHFEPVSEVRWRAVFQVKEKEDMAITLPLPLSSANLPSE